MLRSLDQRQKAAIRREFLARRANFVVNSKDHLSSFSLKMAHHCLELIQAVPKGLIASYRPREDEANPNLLVNLLPDYHFAYPVVEGNELTFWVPKNEAAWRKGAFEIDEPDPLGSDQVSLDDCQTVLVPGLAFDRFGWRVGYGKGFYDRALADYSGMKIGIGFSVQMVEGTLPNEEGDVRMDWLVTEKARNAKVTLVATEKGIG